MKIDFEPYFMSVCVCASVYAHYTHANLWEIHGMDHESMAILWNLHVITDECNFKWPNGLFEVIIFAMYELSHKYIWLSAAGTVC